MYFVWYDDNPKKSITAKIDEAITRYTQKYGTAPQVCLLNETTQNSEDYTAILATNGLKVLPAKHVRQNYFWMSGATLGLES
jgi:hypothetical protein